MHRARYLVLAVLSAMTIVQALGQSHGQSNEPSRIDVFGGYSFASIDDKGTIGHHIILNGWNGALAVNVNRHLGLVSDFGGYYGSPKVPDVAIAVACPVLGCDPATTVSVHANTKAHTFLFGPQINFRTEGLTSFVHGLFGGAHSRASVTGASGSISDSAFAMALGAGFDADFSHRVGLRVQGDYLQTQLFNNTEKNFRFSTGLVFHFGK